jgi:predicted phosphodiesterase
MLIGDVHRNLNFCERMIHYAAEQSVDLIIQLGDWGFMWPPTIGFDTAFGGEYVRINDEYQRLAEVLESYGQAMWFIDGNHDDHNRLHTLPQCGRITEDIHSLVYLHRGSSFVLDGVKFVAMGGAYSVDKDWRNGPHKPHWDGRNQSWWPNEEITEEELQRGIAWGSFDVLLCHDKPLSTQARSFRKSYPECLPNAERIQRLVESGRPKFVFHGHLHERTRQVIDLPGGWMTLVETLDHDFAEDSLDSALIVETDELKSINRYLDAHPIRHPDQLLTPGLR